MGNTNVGIRIGVEGDADVRSSFDTMGAASDASTKRIIDNFDRQSAAAQVAIAARDAAAQKAAAAAGVAGSNTSFVGDQNAQVKAYNAYLADQARQAEALRNAIDPLRTAQAAYDNELRTANSLRAQGAISQAEYDQAVTLSAKNLQNARARLGEAAEGYNKLGSAGLIADHVVRSFSDSIAAGQSPVRAATMEFGRVAEGLGLWAAQSGATEGAAGKLAGFMSGGWGLALQIGIAAIVPLVGELLKTDDAAKKAAEEGLKNFEQREKELGTWVDSTTGKLRAQNAEMARLTAAQFPAAIQGKAVEAQGDTNSAFAAARAQLKAAGSTRAGPRDPALSRAIADAGSNSTTLAKNIDALVAAGRNDLAPLANAVGLFASNAMSAAQAIRTMQGDQTELNTRLHGGALLTTDLVKTMVDRQLATDAVSRAQQNLSEIEGKEADLKAMPGGPAKQAALKEWQAQLVSARKAVENAQSAEQDAAAASRQHARDLKEAAKQAAEFEKAIASVSSKLAEYAAANGKKINEGFAADFKDVEKQLGDYQKDDLAPKTFASQQLAAQKEALTYSQAELDTVTLGSDQRQVALDLVKKTIELQANQVDLDSDQAKAILAGVAAQDQMNRAIAVAAAAMEEVRNFGGQLVDDLASGKSIAQDLYQEFIKLAALNPLKNLINGNSNLPTLGSVFGAVSNLFGGSSTLTSGPFASGQFGASSIGVSAPHYASGTGSASGGASWVAENGPELINLPRGATVTPADQTRRILNQSGQPQLVQVSVVANDYFDAKVQTISNGSVASAAPAIAAGGGRMGQKFAAQRARYSLSGR